MATAVAILIGIALIQLFINLVLFFATRVAYEELKDLKTTLLPIEFKEEGTNDE